MNQSPRLLLAAILAAGLVGVNAPAFASSKSSAELLQWVYEQIPGKFQDKAHKRDRLEQATLQDLAEQTENGGQLGEQSLDDDKSPDYPSFENTDGIVYEDSAIFEDSTFFTDVFYIDEAGTYEALLSDFSFPKPLGESGLSIATGSELLGSVLGPGAFTFSAEPGKYFLSFFGETDGFGQYGIEVSLAGGAAVPVPAAFWLFGSGLVGLAGLTLKNRKNGAKLTG
jgi:hypothetical protein